MHIWGYFFNMKQIKCYTYLRVSTAMQVDGFSLDAQRERLKKYAFGNEMCIVGEYCDAGRSGKNLEGRPDFKRMLDDIQSGKDDIAFVLVFKLSRFGRNAADVLSSLQFMQSYGVNLICVDDGIDSSKDSGKLMISVLSAVAEIERENILVQTMEGRKQKAREGRWNGGFAPYGYDLVNGELKVVEDEAEIIRLIFEKFITTSLGIGGVADWMNNQGYRKKLRQNNKLESFSVHFVKGVLDNPVYCGKIAFGRRKTEKVKGKVNESHVVKNEDYRLYDGIHDAIITEETWNAAQAKRKLTGHANPKRYNPEHEHILTGLLKCPVCGAGMTGNFSRKHGKDKYERFYYHCKHARFLPDGRKCDYKKNWNQDDVNQAVEQIVRALVCNPDFEAAMKTKIGDNLDATNLETEIKNLRTQLRKKEAAKALLIQQIDDLDPDDAHYARKAEDLNARLNQFYYSLDEIDRQIEEAEKRLASVQQKKITGDTIYKYLLYFDRYYDGFTDAEKKEFMQTFIERIDIFEQKQDDGRFLKSIEFKFPVYFNGGYVKQLGLTDENTLETVVLLSQQKPKFTVDIDIKP